MTRTRETRFTEPTTVAEADQRLATLTANIADIEAQIEVWSGEDERKEWRRRALGAKAYLVAERKYVRGWRMAHLPDSERQRLAAHQANQAELARIALERERLKTERVAVQAAHAVATKPERERRLAERQALIARLADALEEDGDLNSLAMLRRLFGLFCHTLEEHGIALPESEQPLMGLIGDWVHRATDPAPIPLRRESA